MLFLIGRTFIRKNVDRWFLPDTQQVIRDGPGAGGGLTAPSWTCAWKAAAAHIPPGHPGGPGAQRDELGFDLVGRVRPGEAPQVGGRPRGLAPPRLEPLLAGAEPS